MSHHLNWFSLPHSQTCRHAWLRQQKNPTPWTMLPWCSWRLGPSGPRDTYFPRLRSLENRPVVHPQSTWFLETLSSPCIPKDAVADLPVCWEALPECHRRHARPGSYSRLATSISEGTPFQNAGARLPCGLHLASDSFHGLWQVQVVEMPLAADPALTGLWEQNSVFYTCPV